VLIYACLFGIGYVIFGEMMKALIYLIAGLIAGGLILRNLNRAAWQPSPDDPAKAQDIATAA
jgi:hypothetical protein